MLEALEREEGLLLLGASEYMDRGWAAWAERDETVRWVIRDGSGGLFRCASPLEDGQTAVLVQGRRGAGEKGDAGDSAGSALLVLDRNGETVLDVPLPNPTEWLIAGKGGYYAIGYAMAREEGAEGRLSLRPRLVRLDSAGNVLWSLDYATPGYVQAAFRKGVLAGESLLLIGEAWKEEGQAYVGLIYSLSPDGQALWTNEAALGADTRINDVCATQDGLIAGTYSGMTYDGDGFPIGREASVFCLDRQGAVLWETSLEPGRMADWVLPMAGGFLLVSRGLDLENCPFLGDGWLQLLDFEGKVKAQESTPDIGGGLIEVTGASLNPAGEAVLCGTVLYEPGFPALPFTAALDFPEALQ